MCPDFYERFLAAHRQAGEILQQIGKLLTFLQETEGDKSYPEVRTRLGTQIGLLPAARLRLALLAREDARRQLDAYEKQLLAILPLPPRPVSEECAAILAEGSAAHGE